MKARKRERPSDGGAAEPRSGSGGDGAKQGDEGSSRKRSSRSRSGSRARGDSGTKQGGETAPRSSSTTSKEAGGAAKGGAKAGKAGKGDDQGGRAKGDDQGGRVKGEDKGGRGKSGGNRNSRGGSGRKRRRRGRGRSGGGGGGGGGGGSSQKRKPKRSDVGFWGEPERLPEAGTVRLADDPAAVPRSLGHPNLPGHEAIAQHYFRVVYERAVQTAGALAAAGGLIDPQDMIAHAEDDED